MTNTGTFAVQSAATLQAGSAAIGKLAANSGVDIGDVDVTSISAGTNRIGMVGLKANEAADGSGTERHVLSDAAGHLQIDVISAPSTAVTNAGTFAVQAACSGTVTANLSATDNAVLDVVAAKTTLQTTSEIKELLSNATVNQATLSAELDTEHYEKIRIFGETSAAVGSDIKLFGSNTSGGTYYYLNNGDLQATTLTVSGLGSAHYIGGSFENIPRYIKVFNNSGSSNHTFTKLYMVGSGGRVAV